MDFKIPFYMTLLFAGIVEIIVFMYLSVREKNRYLYAWTLGWVLFFLRAVLELVYAFQPWIGFLLMSRLSMLTGTCFLLLGTLLFRDIRIRRSWLLFICVIGAYSVFVLANRLQYLPIVRPVYLMIGFFFLFIWFLLIRSPVLGRTGKYFIGWVFFIWGLNELLAGFFPLSVGSSLWSYQISGFYSILIAVGTIVSYFDRIRIQHADSEERYRSLFQQNRAPMLTFDPATKKILDMNGAALRFYGYTKENLGDLTLYDLAVEDKEIIDQGIEDVLRKGNRRFEIINRTAGGEEKEVEVFNGTVTMGGKTVLTSIVSDITERKRAERDLETARDELEKANIIKQEFMANISHELRTPLNGILGMASLLKATELNEEQLNYLDMINVSGENLFRVISDILNFSDIVSKDFELEISDFNLRDHLEGILRRFRAEAESKNLDLRFSFDDDVAGYVRTDKVRVSQIFLNLISNAVKFTEKGIIEVSVHAEGRDTVISVSDTGVGIEKNNLDAIFGMFTLGVSAYTKRYAGAGVGLAIVKELVDKLEGTISVESDLGEGSEFTVRLPLEAVSAETVEIPVPLVERRDEKIKTENLRILVAEDEVINRMYIEEFLRLQGVDVVSVRTGLEALERASEETFDIILMDISMPRMNGLEAAQGIRSRETDRTPIIALTAYTYPEDIRRCMEAGMDDFLPKPVDENRLMEVIRKYVT